MAIVLEQMDTLLGLGGLAAFVVGAALVLLWALRMNFGR